jgi:hypothetical protein
MYTTDILFPRDLSFCRTYGTSDVACYTSFTSTYFYFRFLLHDPRVYHEPMEFKPERFLGPTPEPDPRNACFGFGRRLVDTSSTDVGKLINVTLTRRSVGYAQVSISFAVFLLPYAHKLYLLPSILLSSPTLGRVLADASVFISVASVLSVFNVSKCVENGVVIEPPIAQTSGTIR